MSEADKANFTFDLKAVLRPSVFWTFWVICALMTVAPGMPWHGWRGVLLIAIGLVMLAQPPRVQIPRLQMILAAAFLLLACMVFLPAAWFPVPSWRAPLSANGVSLGGLVTAHPLQTLECLSGFATGLIAMMYLTGHRVDHGGHHLMGTVFAAGVALVAILAIGAREYHWVFPWSSATTFGFFPNRNHMATLLVMGAMAGAGVAVQSFRVRTWGSGVLAIISVAVCVVSVISYSESRAGVVLLAGALISWGFLLGRRYWRGRILIPAVILVAAGVVFFATRESAVKKRLSETADRFTAIAGAAVEGGGLWNGQPGTDSLQSLDLRLPIFLDTVDMVRHAPLTGVGAGQFRYVFPQYRHFSAVANQSQSLHPENDWLLMAAETGVPATVVLLALVSIAGVSALREALHGRARALRTGCLVGAAVLPLHGLFDVPAHRMELVLPACWLLAISLRVTDKTRQSTRACRLVFQGLGVGIMGAGIFLIQAQWFGGRTPSVLLSPQTVEEVMALHAEDVAEQQAESAGVPASAREEDRLETALLLLDNAIKVTPMDAHLHYLKGAIALHFDDKDAEVDRAFAAQRLLDPTWVALPLTQASAWDAFNASRVEGLWAEAMKRAKWMDDLAANTTHGRRMTFALIMKAATLTPDLLPAALHLVENDMPLFDAWAVTAGANRVDTLMPGILAIELPEIQRQELLRIWGQRGSRLKAEAYARPIEPPLQEVKPPDKQIQEP
jgi:O-antigen ligase